VIGVVSKTDLLALAADGDDPGPSYPRRWGWQPHRRHRAPSPATARDLMTHPAVTISPDELVQAAARHALLNHAHGPVATVPAA